MSWECFPVWVMASMGSSISMPTTSEQAPKETAVAEVDVPESDIDSDTESAESDHEESFEHTAVVENTVNTVIDEEISSGTNKENSDSIDDYEAIIKAEKERLEEIAKEIAKYTHTGISVEGGCRACAYQYELNGQTQADSARGAVDEVKVVEEQKGGPLDQLSCTVM